MRVSVVGTGYLGAVHAVCLAELGFDVVGIDIDAERIEALSRGFPPFFEPGFEELLGRVLRTKRIHFTTDMREAADADVHFLCVSTPQRNDGLAADLANVFSAGRALAANLSRPSVIVGKSTVPVGTTEHLTRAISEASPAGADLEVAWNPEFLREGFAVADTMQPDRIVIGVQGPNAEPVLRSIYADMIAAGTPVLVMDVATAELVKVAANAFLATKISFINAMAEVCEAAGADIGALADALGHDPRIGRRFLNAGIGFGGGCLPKDIRAFAARAEELGVPEAVGFLHEVDTINMRRRVRAVDLVRNLVGGSFDGTVVAVLGVAFKPDSDDIRDSPALDIAQAIASEGAVVRIHDPKALGNAMRRYPSLTPSADPSGAIDGTDAVLHLTEWREYRDLDPLVLRKRVRHARLFDGRHTLDAGRWRAAGWQVRSLGSGTRERSQGGDLTAAGKAR